MMHQYYRQPGMRFGSTMTPMVKYLIISNAVVYFLQFLTKGYLDTVLSVTPECFKTFFLWQPFTYLFLHSRANPWHLLFNMLWLYIFGCDLEKQWGARFFLKYYLVCGVGAGFIIALVAYLGGGITLGASGAIFGLGVAFALLFPNAKLVLFPLFIPIKARTLVLVFVVFEAFAMVGMVQDNVSHLGHVAGAAIGFLYLKKAWYLGRTVERLRWKFKKIKFKIEDSEDSDDNDQTYYH